MHICMYACMYVQYVPVRIEVNAIDELLVKKYGLLSIKKNLTSPHRVMY